MFPSSADLLWGPYQDSNVMFFFSRNAILAPSEGLLILFLFVSKGKKQKWCVIPPKPNSQKSRARPFAGCQKIDRLGREARCWLLLRAGASRTCKKKEEGGERSSWREHQLVLGVLGLRRDYAYWLWEVLSLKFTTSTWFSPRGFTSLLESG